MAANVSAGVSGAVTGAKAGSVFGPWGAAAGGIIGGAVGLFAGGGQKKVNVAEIIAQAQQQARNNLQNSINLENEFLPGTALLRQNANQLNTNLSRGLTDAQRAQGMLLDQAGRPITDPGSAVNNPLTLSSLSSILQSLNRGGQLDPDVQAQAVQAALQKGGTAGISGSGAGRGLVARDLGLTSLGLLQQRQQMAMNAGSAYGGLALQGQGLQLQDYLGRLQGVNAATGQQMQYGLGLGGLLASTPYPNSGLGPGQTASLAVGANNQANAIGQQNAANYMNAFNTAAGWIGGGGLDGLFKTNTGASTADALGVSSRGPGDR